MFDKKIYLQKKLQDHFEEAQALNLEIFGIFLQGSQNYGLDLYTNAYQSDVDTKAIVLPSFDSFCKDCSPISTTHIRNCNEHIDLKDIRVIFETFKKQNVNFVEILFTEYYIVSPKYEKYWKSLQSLGEELTHCFPSQTLKTMAGMSGEKRKSLCHPYPTIKDKIDKFGYDGKQLHHILRINDFMKRYIAGEPFAKCLKPTDKELLDQLTDAKLNRMSLKQALLLAEDYDKKNRKLKDEYICLHGNECVPFAYEKLDEINVEILKTWFKEQLTKG